MDSELWLDRWARNEIGFHQGEVNAHLQEYWKRLGVTPGGRVFVPLCGKSRDMLWLRSEGHPVIAVEVSPLAVEAFFRENDLEVQVSRQGTFRRWDSDGLVILQGDFFHLRAPDLADVAGIYDRASLIALPPTMRQRYAAHLRAIVPRRAQKLLVTMDYEQSAMDGPPFAVTEVEVEALYGDAYAVQRLFVLDVLDESPRFRERGLSRLEEKVYRLVPRNG